MTNDLTVKQAVGELKAMKKHIEPYMSVVGVTAYDMAIQALEQTTWIPKNATNGDMIISLYSNLKYYVKGDRVMTTIGVASSFDLDWWNAPYREEDAE